jgi:hypothetical protein
VVPLVATFALGWAVQYGIRKGFQAIAGQDPVDGSGKLRAEQG